MRLTDVRITASSIALRCIRKQLAVLFVMGISQTAGMLSDRLTIFTPLMDEFDQIVTCIAR
jgi:hypothetical protein